MEKFGNQGIVLFPLYISYPIKKAFLLIVDKNNMHRCKIFFLIITYLKLELNTNSEIGRTFKQTFDKYR